VTLTEQIPPPLAAYAGGASRRGAASTAHKRRKRGCYRSPGGEKTRQRASYGLVFRPIGAETGIEAVGSTPRREIGPPGASVAPVLAASGLPVWFGLSGGLRQAPGPFPGEAWALAAGPEDPPPGTTDFENLP